MTSREEPETIREDVLLSTVGAFGGTITPDIRGIAAGWVRAKASCRVFFDHPPSDDDHEMVSVAETEVMADLLTAYPGYSMFGAFDFQAIYVPNHVRLHLDTADTADTPHGLGPGWRWIYKRRESWPYDA